MSYLKPFLLLCAIAMLTACKKDKEEIVLPTLYTEDVHVVGDQYVSASGIVSDEGGGTVSARGFCWGIFPEPTLNAGSVLNVGNGKGSFSSEIENLSGGTVYYLRTFATNEAGTAYGNTRQFTTVELAHFDHSGATIYIYPYDIQPHFVWGPTHQFLGVTHQGNGSGNTTTISNNSESSAAKKCAELEAFGHSDWYLPAILELEKVYENRDLAGNFGEDVYWSSTEVDAVYGMALDFTNGDMFSRNKGQQARCRCIRKDY